MNHYLSTRDKVWLKTAGYPMSLEIARFFANRFVPCTRHPGLGKYCMNDVMGPENWNKQNNTCEIVACGALALRWALRASAITALPLPADATNWSTIADNVYLPHNTSFGGYTPAFDTYYLCNETGSQGPHGPCVLDTSSVQQLIYPLRFAASLGSKVAAALTTATARNDIYLYDDYGVIHGNAIMYGTGFVVPYLLLGDEGRANSWFAKSMSRFVGGPFQCWYEDPERTVGAGGGGTPNFLTGAGGWLQVMVMGWAGLNWADETGDDTGPSVLQLTPRIPANTTTLTVEGISFVGARLSLNISVGYAMLTLLSKGNEQVQVSFFPATLARAEGLDIRNAQDDSIVPPVAITLAVGQGVRVALGKLLNVSVTNVSVEHEWSQSLKTDDDVARPGQTTGTDDAQLPPFASAGRFFVIKTDDDLLRAIKTDDKISLDGDQWRFQLENLANLSSGDPPGGAGLRTGQEWYRLQHPEPVDSIRVPGSWGSQGFGNKTAAYRHAWSGVGWYYRNLSIPASWCTSSGSSVVLTIGGVMRRGRAWLDGVELSSEHIGYMDEWNLPLQHALICDSESKGAVGVKRLAVRVDNRANHSDGDCFSGCLDLRGMEAILQVADEHTPTGMEWGGIWDHVSLRFWPSNSVSDLFVYPSHPSEVVWGAESVDLFVNISLYEPATASGATVHVVIAPVDTEGGAVSSSVFIPAAAQSAQLKLVVKSPKLWSPDTPALYTAVASWGNEFALNTTIKFGIKHLTTNGSALVLNGAALYIHGVGDDFTYLESEAPPLDKDLYRERLLIFKRFGFNFIRLHSHFEAREYMDTAAEIGILLSPALPMGAKNGSSHCARLDLAEKIYRRTWTSLILKYRNNPCLLDYSMGNEYYGMPGRPAFPFRDSFYAIAKSLDPHRLVLDTDGCCWNAKGCGTGGTCNRSTNDFMVQFMGYTDNLVDQDQFAGYDEAAPPKPIISHEAGDFNAMQDMATALASYTEQVNALPLSLAPAVLELERHGLLNESASWAVSSGALYTAMFKSTVEDMRARQYISGYAWWTMYSYPGCAQGILTADFKPKAVEPSQILAFNTDAVLLLAGLPRSIAVGSSTSNIVVQLSLSNYLPSTLNLISAKVHWSLTGCDDDGTTVYGSRVSAPNTTSAAQGAITPLSGWAVPLPAVVVPTCVVLQSMVDGHSCLHCSGAPVLRNDWTFWLLPKAPPITTTVYTTTTLLWPLRQTGAFDQVQLLPNMTMPLPSVGATYVVSKVTPPLQAALQAGATVFCVKCPATVPGGGVVAYGPGLWATMGPGGARGVGNFMSHGTPLESLARDARWLDFRCVSA
jgi:hypothetical protein